MADGHRVKKQRPPIPLKFQKVYNEMRCGYEDAAEEESPHWIRADSEQQYAKLVSDLGLDVCREAKITIQDVMQIGGVLDLDNDDGTLAKYPRDVIMWLKRIVSLDHRTRDRDVPPLPSDKPSCEIEETDDDDEDDFFGDRDVVDVMYPMDFFLLVYLSCEMSLKQLLVRSCFLCRHAIPLVIPDYETQGYSISLTALSNIILECSSPNGKIIESSAPQAACRTIAFVKMGSLLKSKRSKSQILNNFLDDSGHSAFVNWNSKNGNKPRTISSGMIEASWLLPKRSDTRNELTCVLNLRGDGFSYPDHLHLFSTVADIVVCMVEVDDVHNYQRCIDAMVSLPSALPVVLMVFTNSRQNISRLKSVNESKRQGAWKGMKVTPELNLKSIVERLQHLISEISAPIQKTCMQQRFENSWKLDGLAYRNESNLCQNLVQEIEIFKIHDLKSSLFRLQGRLWHECSTLQKICYRSMQQKSPHESDTEADFKQRCRDDIKDKRKQQLDEISKVPTVMTKCFSVFLNLKGESRLQFLNMLSHALNSKCFEILPALYRQYQELCAEYKEKKTSAIGRTLNDLEKIIIDSSVGIEHVFREMAQMYEAEKSHFIPAVYKCFPEMAASMLLEGQPLELLDGDAGNMPMEWIKAVFDNLKAIIGLDKSVLVISVLGIQSSGKSTLLNTMFGFRFAVSAGRCTKGVYMQMVKTNDKLPADYVIVLDTEGLRAAKLSANTKDRDNELATFVIGAADITIINVKGENYAEMKDVMQIAVHAFFRMTLVNKMFNMRKRCVFIHQNSSSANVKAKLQVQCKTLQEALDAMTVEAARQEGKLGVSSFNEINSFDCDRDVWFFPDLWQGTPPMSFVNPDYSSEVINVRRNLFAEIADNDRQSFKTMEYFQEYMCDLWNAVLTENFVFSFQNSLEIKAYILLDNKYQELLRNYQRDVNQLERQAIETISNLSKLSDLSDLSQLPVLVESKKSTENKGERCIQLFKVFSKQHPDAFILSKWFPSKLDCLKGELEMLRVEAERELEEMCNRRKYYLDCLGSEGIVIKQIKQKAADLSSREIDQTMINREFDLIWQSLGVDTVESSDNMARIEHRVESDMEKCLKQVFQAHSKHISQALVEIHMRDDDLSWHIPKLSIDHINVYHLKEQQNYDQSLPEWDLFSSYVIKQVKDFIEEDLNEQFIPYISKEHYYTKTFIIDLLNRIKMICIEGLNDHKDIHITLLPLLQASFAVWGVKLAFRPLCTLMKVHSNYTSQKYAISQYRERLFQYYLGLIKCEGNTYDLDNVANFIASSFGRTIRPAIKRLLLERVRNELIHRFVNKSSLIHAMLDTILSDSDNIFEDFQKLIEDPRRQATSWMTRYVFSNLWKTNIVPQTLLELDENVTEYVTSVTGQLSSTESVNVQEWLTRFWQRFEYDMSPEDKLDATMYPDGDTQVNAALLQHSLLPMMKNEINKLNDIDQASLHCTDLWIERVIDECWGCTALCPFCKAPCSIKNKRHIEDGKDHQCDSHRPVALGGFYDDKSNMLHVLDCSEAICNSTLSYKHDDKKSSWLSKHLPWFSSKGRKSLFKNYKSNFRNWSISDISSNPVPLVWQWFVATHSSQLAEKFGCKVPNIPSRRTRYTIDEVQENLHENN